MRRWVLGLGLLIAASGTLRADTKHLSDDEDAILFPALAARTQAGWRITVRGWVFERETESLWRAPLVRQLRRRLGVAADTGEARRLADIASWLLADNERNKQLALESSAWSGQIAFKSAPNGHFQGTVDVATMPADATVRIASTAAGARVVSARIYFVTETGWSVISDLDDTIKISEVLVRERLLRRTFTLPFEAVPDMAPLYAELAQRGAVFHYVSGSPWQLFRPLETFLHQAGFPDGLFHLRVVRPKDQSVDTMLHGTRAHKLTAIRDIVRRYPKRQFILIGDAGEKDPEVYGQIAREFPQQVTAIALRRLSGDGYEPRRAAAMAQVTARIVEFSQPPMAAQLVGP